MQTKRTGALPIIVIGGGVVSNRTPEELAKDLFKSASSFPEPYLYLAETLADEGYWGQVAAIVMSAALNSEGKITIDSGLVAEAIEMFGRDELGVLVDRYTAADTP